MKISYQPLILIGAARSGTKLLRNIIARHPLIDKVPYDVNYVWRIGNENFSHDEFAPETLTLKNHKRIVRQLTKFHTGAPFLIEKTVSNCLRIPFVNSVFPKAVYIHLVRDGYDVVESAYRQWQAPPDWRYVFQKARSFPVSAAPSYAVNYAFSLLLKLFYKRESQAFIWGPRYAGIDDDINYFGLLEVCAIQWTQCVVKAMEGLATIEGDRVLTIRYEDFVYQPLANLNRIATFLNIDPDPYREILNEKSVSQDNIGKGKRRLTEEQMARIKPHLEKGLKLLNYA